MAGYKIVEHFTSIQGEGLIMSYPVTFVRLFGCNLNCSFCDEPLHTEAGNIKIMTEEEILEVCPTKVVVITGGEPSLNDINSLIKFLQKAGKFVQVESNGYKHYNIRHADHRTIAPKTGDFKTLNPENWSEAKLLVSTETSESVLEEAIKYWFKAGVKVFLQPVNKMDKVDMDNLAYTIKMCTKFSVPLSPQLHKLLGVE